MGLLNAEGFRQPYGAPIPPDERGRAQFAIGLVTKHWLWRSIRDAAACLAG